MADNKSVLEQALLEAQQLEEAVKSNAKEILAATMKQEIEELVKESLNEQEEDDFVGTSEEEVSVEFDDDDFDDEEYEDQEEEELMIPAGEEAMVSMEMDTDEPTLDLTQASDEEVMKVFKAMGAEDGIVVTQDGDTIELEDQGTGTEYKIELAESKFKNNLLINEGYDNDSMVYEYVDDEEIMEMEKDFEEGWKKGMSEMKMKDMYEMKMKDMYEMEMDDEMSEMKMKDMYEMEMDDEPIYEISLEDEMAMDEEDMDIEELQEMEDMSYEEMEEGDYGFKRPMGRSKQGYLDREDEMLGGEHGHEDSEFSLRDRARMARGTRKFDQEMEEASRTYGFGSKSGRGLRKGFTNNRNLDFPINESSRESINKILKTAKQLQTENQHFRQKNKEYRQALKVFRDKLNEVAVFNANLAYSTKLFTEHTTTKKEKVNILRRFDGVKTLNESKNLFNTLNSEFNSKVNKLNESVQKTITKTPSGGSSVNLIESKTYESPQITRMREIMNKL
jgi:hypothetical protein